MIRFLSLTIICLLLWIIAVKVESKEQRPYFVAVFGTPGIDKLMGWDKVKPDKMTITGEWEAFDKFLIETRKEAKGRPILLDIECHGIADTGMLELEYSCFQGKEHTDDASVGYVVGKIDKYLGNTNVEVCLEACYSQICIQRSLKSKAFIESDDFHVSSFDKPIKFPIWGIGRCVNWNNTVCLQILYNRKSHVFDIRKTAELYEQPDKSKESDVLIHALFIYLYLFAR